MISEYLKMYILSIMPVIYSFKFLIEDNIPNRYITSILLFLLCLIFPFDDECHFLFEEVPGLLISIEVSL